MGSLSVDAACNSGNGLVAGASHYDVTAGHITSTARKQRDEVAFSCLHFSFSRVPYPTGGATHIEHGSPSLVKFLRHSQRCAPRQF